MAIFKWVVTGLFSNGESWNTGYHFSTPANQAASDSTVACGLFLDSLWTGAAGGSPGIEQYNTPSVTLTGCTIYVLDPTTGHAIDKARVTRALSGTAAGTQTPNQIAVCVSLRTNTPGRRGRGRSFLPGVATSFVNAVGRVGPGVAAGYANSVGASLLITQQNGFTPILFTKGQPNRTIVSADAGDVLDTQRRRRDKLIESRSAAAPATTGTSVSVLLP